MANLAAAVGALIALLWALPCVAQVFGSGLPCQYAYNQGGTPQPAAYAPPWDTVGSFGLLGTVNCASGSTLTVGGGSNQYVLKSAFVSTDGITWNPITLTGTAGPAQWITSAATFNLGLTTAQIAGWTYVEYLVATKVTNGWAMGGCSKPRLNQILDCVPKYSVQAFYQPPQLISAVSLSPTTFPALTAGFQVGALSTTMNAASPAFSGTLTISGTNSCGFTLSNGNVLAGSHCQGGTYSDWNVIATPSDNHIPTATFAMSASAWTTNGLSSTNPNASIQDSTANGTTIATVSCTDTLSVACTPVTYSLIGAPGFISINPSSGVITTNRPLTSADDGTFNYTVQSLP